MDRSLLHLCNLVIYGLLPGFEEYSRVSDRQNIAQMKREHFLEAFAATTPELPPEYSLFLYGSSTCDGGEQRDIDLCALVPVHVPIKYVCVRIPTLAAPCNLYILSEADFAADVTGLKFGGYYAHKFSLGFSKLHQIGRGFDPASFFWGTAWKRLNAKSRAALSPSELIRAIHGEIFHQRPTFARALAQFVNSRARVQALHLWMSNVDLRSEGVLSWDEAMETSYAYSSEAALWRFWQEYNKHKSGSELWSASTLAKMYSSVAAQHYEIVRAYLGEGSL